MTSQGQRFRRRALRRGYKVDEVDSFLDRVEATLAGDPIGASVTAQEVHDVVFRVRFGGYDEWQVDLHLDRVERQLAELEERGGYGRPDGRPPMADRGPAPERVPAGMPERMGPPPMGPPDRMGPGERMGPPPERMGLPDRAGPPMGPPDRMGSPDRMGPPERMGPPDRLPPAGPMPVRPAAAMPAPGGPPPREPGYGRYDEPTFGGATGDPYEPGRRARADMTAEIRMSDPTFGGAAPPRPGPGMGPGPGPGGMGPGGMGPGPGGPGPGYGGPPAGYGGGPPMGAPAGPALAGDAQRLDQLRRTFQLRRFGSGYDRAQVDQLFEGLIVGLSGRGPLPNSEADLAPNRFELVPGGYFEAEVDAALKEARDILSRRR